MRKRERANKDTVEVFFFVHDKINDNYKKVHKEMLLSFLLLALQQIGLDVLQLSGAAVEKVLELS